MPLSLSVLPPYFCIHKEEWACSCQLSQLDENINALEQMCVNIPLQKKGCLYPALAQHPKVKATKIL